MITFRNITLRRGDKVLLDSTSAAFVPGARIGVVGANGCGKSTLFSVLAGETHTDGGDIEMPPRQTLSRVFQETDASPRPAIDYVLDGDPELRAAEILAFGFDPPVFCVAAWLSDSECDAVL